MLIDWKLSILIYILLKQDAMAFSQSVQMERSMRSEIARQVFSPLDFLTASLVSLEKSGDKGGGREAQGR